MKFSIFNFQFSKLLGIIILAGLLFPLASLAGEYIANGQTITYQGLVPCGGYLVDENNNIIGKEYDCQFCHLFVMLDAIIDFVLIYLIFPIAVLLLVVGGAIFLFSGGDPPKLTQGKEVMTSVIIGLIIIFAAWLLINLFFEAIGISEFGLKFTGPDKWAEIVCPIEI